MGSIPAGDSAATQDSTTLETVALDPRVRRPTVDIVDVLEEHEGPRGQDALAVLGQHDVVGDLDAGMEAFAPFKEADDVPELIGRIDGDEIGEEMFGSLGAVEIDILGFFFSASVRESKNSGRWSV